VFISLIVLLYMFRALHPPIIRSVNVQYTATLQHTYDYNSYPILARTTHSQYTGKWQVIIAKKPIINVTHTLPTQNLNVAQIDIHYTDHKTYDSIHSRIYTHTTNKPHLTDIDIYKHNGLNILIFGMSYCHYRAYYYNISACIFLTLLMMGGCNARNM
jgi:hypothetical protein